MMFANLKRMIHRFRIPGYIVIALGLLYLAWRLSVAFLVAARIERTDGVKLLLFLLSAFLVLLFYLVFRSLFRLFLERRKRIVGSMIKSRLTASFFLVSIVPVLLLSMFIAVLIDLGIRTVYQPKVENALDFSIRFIKGRHDLTRRYFTRFIRDFFPRRPGMFRVQGISSPPLSISYAGRVRTNAEGLGGLPSALQVLPIKEEGDSELIFTHTVGGLPALVYWKRKAGGIVEYAVCAIDPIFNRGANVVSSALSEYRQIRLLREPLQVALVYLTLLLVILIALLVILVAMRLARAITDPIKALAEGTRRIASGDLNFRVPPVGRDELGLLVSNFNSMSDELQKSRIRLFHAERIAAWQEVARRLAHEIKNPLTPIKLAAERVLRQSRKHAHNLNEIIERALPAIMAEVESIQRLVDEFASFARLPEKREEILPLATFLEESLMPFRQAHEMIEFSLQVPQEPVTILFDPNQFKRAIANLIQNAVHAITEKGTGGRIEVAVTLEKGNAVLSFHDNGCGIPEQLLEDIFNPYFSATEGGTGLGLVIVEKIVVDHNGKIWVHSREGEGTTFYIEVPVLEESQHD